MSHHCHARGCATPVPPHLFMCLRHWRMVSHLLQLRIWETYRHGQEIRKDPSDEYLAAADAAIAYVAAREAEIRENARPRQTSMFKRSAGR